jgi:hypothetical protein
LILYMGACYIWPLPGLGIQEFINPEDNPRIQAIIEGQETGSQKTREVEKIGDEEKAHELSDDSSGRENKSSL